jgi:hypothetical protein
MSASSPSKQSNGFFPFIVGYSEEFLVGLVDGVISSVGMVVHETVPASTSRQRQSERRYAGAVFAAMLILSAASY